MHKPQAIIDSPALPERSCLKSNQRIPIWLAAPRFAAVGADLRFPDAIGQIIAAFGQSGRTTAMNQLLHGFPFFCRRYGSDDAYSFLALPHSTAGTAQS
jgi:hypothetical protein